VAPVELLTVERAVELALSANPGVQAAALVAQGDDEAVAAARTQYLPTISGQAHAGRLLMRRNASIGASRQLHRSMTMTDERPGASSRVLSTAGVGTGSSRRARCRSSRSSLRWRRSSMIQAGVIGVGCMAV
jgi:outer membrane protein TolC